MRVLDANGNAMVDQNLTDTGASISSDYLTAGMIYSLNVTAYAAADDSVTESATLYFSYVPAPAAEPEAVEPESTEPEYTEPEYTEPEYTEPEYTDPEPDPEPEDTEPEEPAADYPTDDPSAWSTAITPDFDFEGIVVLQQRLVEWKWLAKDGYYEGVLDEATVQAIVDFQTVCAENGIDLIPCDPMDPVIETDTLALLFNANGEVYANPYA